MWIKKKTSIQRRKAFGSKRDKVNETIHISLPEKYFFPASSINDLIDTLAKYSHSSTDDGVNVIIAAPTAPQTSTSPVGEVKENQPILIFAPAELKGKVFKDLGIYYTINISDFKVHWLPPGDKTMWSDNYIDHIVGDETKGLASTIDPKSSYNKVGGKLSDTRSISYPYSEFNDFIKLEKDFQNSIKPSHEINGIEIWFAAYPDSGIGKNRHDYPTDELRNRLLLMFEFTKKRKLSGGNRIFYIDKSKGFKHRPRPSYEEKGGNNGQLCPPDC
jgi:hypothetical protein